MGEKPLEFNAHEMVERARTTSGTQLENLLYHRSRDVLEALLENPHLGEQQLAVLLARRDLPREIVTRIAQSKEWMKSYSLKVAVVKHPRAPRHLTVPLLKFLYLFDLLAIAAAIGVPAELKRMAENAILSQKEGIALGQRLSLARRGSTRIAGGLLADTNPKVLAAALENPSLTDHSVAAALLQETVTSHLTDAVIAHPRWAMRHPVKLALLRSPHLSLARLMGILADLSLGDLSDLAVDPRVAKNIQGYAARTLQARRSHMNAK